MNPRRAYADYVRDILVHAQRAQEFVRGVDLASFREDIEKTFAVTRALEVIGEAARQLPAAVRRRYPNIPWSRVIGMRNILAHGYFGVNEDVLWRTVHEDLPPLCEALEEMLRDLQRREGET